MIYLRRMTFLALQESLRQELRRRISGGELTGQELARRTGFTQAHVSNFLNRKRGLKLRALDRMLKAISLSLYDLLNPRELARFAEAPTGSDAEYADVPVVSTSAAARRNLITNDDVLHFAKLKRAALEKFRADAASPGRKEWTRFVFVELDGREAEGLWPRAAPGALALLDRHSNLLRPATKSGPSLYAVRKGEEIRVGYLEPAPGWIVVRPHNSEMPIEVIPLAEGQTAYDLVIGRVAYIASEV